MIPKTVVCPRCGRTGHVEADQRRPGWYEVTWEPRAATASQSAMPSTKDAGLTAAELCDPKVGCGYDGPEQP